MNIKKAFEISESEIIDGKLCLKGRAYEDFTTEDEVFVKNNRLNNYKQVIIEKFIIYHREINALYAGLTEAIFLDWNFDSFDEFDNYLYIVVKI